MIFAIPIRHIRTIHRCIRGNRGGGKCSGIIHTCNLSCTLSLQNLLKNLTNVTSGRSISSSSSTIRNTCTTISRKNRIKASGLQICNLALVSGITHLLLKIHLLLSLFSTPSIILSLLL